MTKGKNYISPRGYKRLRDEQRYLRLVERPQIVEEVSFAAALGDRSENAEYIYGKRRMREIDRRLRFLDGRIRDAIIVDPATDRGERVFFGATVTLGYADGSEKIVTLLGKDEVNAQKQEISYQSPVGRALIGKSEGDEIRLTHLEQRIEIEIIEVAYLPQVPDAPSKWDQHVSAQKDKG